MPLATNALLQANAAAATKSSAASNSTKAADSSASDRSSFSDVYAKQADAKAAARDDVPVKSRSVADKDKSVADKNTSPATDDATAAEKASVAESGNPLPVDPAAAVAGEDADQATDEAIDPALLAAAPAELPVDPTLDPTLQAMAGQAVAAPVIDKAVADAKPVEPSVSLTTAVTSTAAAQPAAPVAEAPFDPNADPLENMPALQFALESAAAKAQQAQNANGGNHAGKNAKAGELTTDQTQNIANNLAALDDQAPIVDEASTESSDKSFEGLLGEGLKDVKGAVGDTRVDNFADRLAAMSQAAQQARPATAPAVPLLNQPLAMHQSGWSEGVVDRVMYLSSQNLKSADIQLEPAELGRLDIRINMAPDQQTQVTFMSAHVGVREALESQMSRLRDSFTQQGLGQVDVNVSDQSRNQQNQQEQQASNTRGTGNNGSGSNGIEGSTDGGGSGDAAVAVSQPAARVIGTSEIDYYA
ncbi:flagellar hook-length control protein FliK [Paucimonas lemoignei]|nr:flagellar hook-length control protein FliK [Paucimonas lemoignei]